MTVTERAPVVLVVGSSSEWVARTRDAIETAAPDASVVDVERGTLEDTGGVEGRVDCVVVDWGSGDSPEELSTLRTHHPTAPVVLVTDASLAAVVERVESDTVADVRPRTPAGLADRLVGQSVAAVLRAARTDDHDDSSRASDERASEQHHDHHSVGLFDEAQSLRDDAYRHLVEQNIVGIYVIEGRTWSYVNPRMAEIFRTTPAEMEGRPIAPFVAPEDRAVVRRNVAAREAGDLERAHYEFTGLCVDGSRITVEASGARVEVGDDVAIVGVLLDVTERRREERERRRLTRAVEHAGPAIYVTDRDGTIIYANPSFERLTGHALSDVIGETPAILKSGRMDDDYYDEMYGTITEGSVWRGTIVDRRATGELYQARQTIAPVRSDEGHIEGFVAIQEDVTEERIRQQVLQVLARVLRHNLRNELNVITGHAEVLCERLTAAGDEAGLASAQAVLQAAAELEELSDRAVTAESALESEETTRQPVDLVELVSSQWARLTEDRTVSLRLESPDKVWVTADATLGIAVRELLRAAHASDEGDETDAGVGPNVTMDHVGSEVELAIELDESSAVEWEAVRTGMETPLDHASGLDLWLVEWVITRLGGDVQLSVEDGTPVLTARLPKGTDDASKRAGES